MLGPGERSHGGAAKEPFRGGHVLRFLDFCISVVRFLDFGHAR